MSELYTRIRPKGGKSGDGFMSSGRMSVEQSIEDIRRYADHLREIVARIDRTADHEFTIDLVRGANANHHVASLQKPRELTPAERQKLWDEEIPL